MRKAIFALILAVLQGLVDALPNPSPLLGSNWGNPKRYVHLQTSSDVNNFYLEISSNGNVRRTQIRSSYSVLLLKAETRERVAILGVKSNRYLCMDAMGNTFSSTICQKEDCLFNHKLLENHRDVYFSCKNGILLNLEGAKQVYTVGQNVPQTSLFLSEKNTVPLERLLHREKRNRVQVDPSDPHNMMGQTEEVDDSRAMPETEDVETDQEFEVPEGQHISRETPDSPFDDPWHVQSLNAPPSPRIMNVMVG
ncbi:hypothetical protein DPEC_G00113700 [Dallia pectoralis]|uniref:Uncharacterized protein n=1 Tax=Dallia pectoralis TaxID=75939 RepID=A0ACC2GU62_DALPE|nr:hypothetical protein DPEC_G00113700 [Dallia pectoralis]